MTVLLEKYLAGTVTPEEREAVLDWWRANDLREIRIPVSSASEIDQLRMRMRRTLEAHVRATQIRVLPVWGRVAAVAATVLVVAGAGWWWKQEPMVEKAHQVATAPKKKNDVQPGHNGAILTLADGTKKVLDSLSDGTIALQGKTVVRLQGGTLAYSATGADAAITYNTMSTPRGRQYRLVLPDGTRVWLNAASSLTFPTVFNGANREVRLEGEAYFEIEHDKRPFRVLTATQRIEDIGTHFNISSYSDEPATVTTLLEGAVTVNGRLLKPGQQGSTTTGAGMESVRVDQANIVQAVAWKNGAFSFSDARLPEILRQLARWYNVDVEYRGPVAARTFSGDIGRDLTLAQVLRVLTKSHIRYQIDDGHRLVILSDDQ
jgi:transmembrane sensor